MTWCFVYIQLEVLIVVQKTTSFFINCEMRAVFLVKKIHIVPVSELSLNFNNLPMNSWFTDGMCITPMTLKISNNNKLLINLFDFSNPFQILHIKYHLYESIDLYLYY